jgi:orotate phosphoribosyltransferase
VPLTRHPEVTAIGGLTIGADPIASAIAALSFETGQNLPAFLVRKEPKGHGTGSRIEGDLAAGQKVAIIEDTVTTGGSARKAIEAVREVGAIPVVVLTIADREDPDADAFRQEFPVVRLVTLSEIRAK